MHMLQGDKVHMFFSVSVEECAFQQPTKYGTQRWTPGGNIMAVESSDNGETWSTPQVIGASHHRNHAMHCMYTRWQHSAATAAQPGCSSQVRNHIVCQERCAVVRQVHRLPVTVECMDASW